MAAPGVLCCLPEVDLNREWYTRNEADCELLKQPQQGWAARAKAGGKKAAKRSAKKAAAAAATEPQDANGSTSTAASADVSAQLAAFRDTAVGALASLEAVLRERLAQPLQEQVLPACQTRSLSSHAGCCKTSGQPGLGCLQRNLKG